MCLSVLQEKQSEMEGLKQQLVEVEKQKDEHGDTIGKLKQVTAFVFAFVKYVGQICKNHCFVFLKSFIII